MLFENILKFLKEHPSLIISFGGACFVALGLVYDITLYSKFDIDILKFAGTEDFLFGWMKDKPSLTRVVGFFIFLFGMLIPFILPGFDKFLIRILNNRNTSNPRKILTTVLYFTAAIACSFATQLIVFTDGIAPASNIKILAGHILMGIALGFILMSRGTWGQLKNTPQNFERANRFSLAGIWLVFMIFMFDVTALFASAVQTANNIKTSSFDPTKIILKKDKSESTENLILAGTLIGSTAEYFFLYNKSQPHQAQIIPKSSVSRIEHTRKPTPIKCMGC